MTKPFWHSFRLRRGPLVLTRRERRVVTLGVVLVALALFYAYVQLPLGAALAAARAELTLQQSRVQAAADAAAHLPEEQARLAALQESAARASAGLPADKSEPAFLRDLARLASDSAVTVRELTFGTPAVANSLSTYPFRLTVSGSEPATRQFLARLENANRLVQVRELSYKGQTLTVDAVMFSDAAGGTTK